MKVGILAGGLGTRLAEETVTRPKPMVEIGNQRILWHIMKHYYGYGHNPGVDEYAAGGIRAGLQPAVGEARFMAGHVQVWDGNEWVNQSPRTGDEYTDLATGEVFAINP